MKKLLKSNGAKVFAFVLSLVFFGLSCLSVALADYAVSKDMYYEKKEDLLYEQYSNYAYQKTAYAALLYNEGRASEQIENSLFHKNNIASAIFKNKATGEEKKFMSEKESDGTVYTVIQEIISSNSGTAVYEVSVTLAKDLPYFDFLKFNIALTNIAYTLRYGVWALALLFLILGIVCTVVLICSAGTRKGKDGAVYTKSVKFPFDLLTVAYIAPIVPLVDLTFKGIGFSVIAVSILYTLTVLWLMSLVKRAKLKVLWENTVINKVFKLIKAAIVAMSVSWKAAVVILAVLLFQAVLFLFLVSYTNAPALLLILASDIVVFPLIIYFAVELHCVIKGAQALARGQTDYKINTSDLILDMKKLGCTLNCLGDGIALAVEEKLKSERLKTDLITNVSHDIKTPLTSIINYSDLILREDCENENVKKYAQVLYRQSIRLKQLTDDLVEASKASSGNIEVQLAPCDASVLMTQAYGEYEEKLTAADVKPVLRLPEESVTVMADGKLMARVLDNLFSNICKYAMPGTRAYISLYTEDNKAVMSFKNISKEEIEDADILKERFVRGDKSRSTEGSGLGLSIAESLVNLQSGRLDISRDGDLFKAEVVFDILKN